MKYIIAIIRLLRPAHWVKNGFIFFPILFSEELFKSPFLSKAVMAFASMSILASSVYVINDIADAKADRLHPIKCNRPIASGEISLPIAVFLVVFLFISAFSIVYFSDVPVMSLLIVYFLVNILYSFELKNIPIIDVFLIATGFLIRLFVGVSISEVEPSNWMLITFFFLALFLGFGKRRGEINAYGSESKNFRKVNANYSIAFLDQVISSLGTIIIICYTLYTTIGEGVRFGKGMIFTTIFVIIGIFYYFKLLKEKDVIQSPTALFFSDRIMFTIVSFWLASCILIIYFSKGLL